LGGVRTCKKKQAAEINPPNVRSDRIVSSPRPDLDETDNVALWTAFHSTLDRLLKDKKIRRYLNHVGNLHD